MFDLDFEIEYDNMNYRINVLFKDIEQIKKVIENNMSIVILYTEGNILKRLEFVRCKDSLAIPRDYSGDPGYIHGIGQNCGSSSTEGIKIRYSKYPYTIDNMVAAWIESMDDTIGIKSIYVTI